MSDYQPIVDAINSLQSSPYKDYIFPISTVLISTLLGLGASIYTNIFQNNINAERHKLRVLNDTTLAVVEMRANLVSIKSLYHGSLSTDPIERMLCIPPLINTYTIPNINIGDLTFLTELGESELHKNKWIRIEFINNLFSNYRNAIEQWMVLSRLSDQTLEKLERHFNNGTIGKEILFHELGKARIIRNTDLNEKILKLTDELIVELTCFLLAFPDATKNFVDKKVKKKYGKTLAYELPKNDFSFDILSHVPQFDMNEMAQLHNVDIEMIKIRHNYTYS